MVVATGKPRLIRVSFLQEMSPTTRNEIVCYLWVAETGFKIYYSHHLTYSRPMPKGQWDRPQSARMGLTPSLQSLIINGVWSELWKGLIDEESAVLTFPGDMDENPEHVKLELELEAQ